MLTELPEMTVLLMVAAVTPLATWTPPPIALNPPLIPFGRDAARLARLPVTVL